MFCTRAGKRTLMTQKSCTVGMRNAKLGNHLKHNISELKTELTKPKWSSKVVLELLK